MAGLYWEALPKRGTFYRLGSKGLTDEFYGCEKVKKMFFSVIYSYLKDSAYTAVKWMQSSKY